jgi:hypothetical protein
MNIQHGDWVFLQCCYLKRFNKQVLPTIQVPFIIFIGDGDETFPDDCPQDFDVEEFLSNNQLIHVFVQNNAYKGPSTKVTSIPIGMDFHTVAYKGESGGWGVKGSPLEQEGVLKDLLKTFLPTHQRKMKAFVDFQWSDTMHGDKRRYLQFGEDRTSIFHRLLPTGLIDHGPWVKRSDLWKKKGEYAFSISPHGNGLDCHRTWEDLVLGCIVIVKSSPLDVLYEGLPVIIIKDWDEITESNLKKWLKQYGDAFTNPEYRKKLTNSYWLQKMQQIVKQKIKDKQ